MSDSTIIKEFLVALGFKIDDAKKFEEGVKRATKVVTELAVATEAAGAVVVGAVVKIGEQFEDLYYASQRIHASVENIHAAEFALGQVGGTAKGMRAALENVAESLRMNPGREGYLNSLGVQTRTATGDLRDMTDVVHDFGKAMKNLPYWQAARIAQGFGIDALTLQALMRDSDQFSDRYHEMAKRLGVDQQAAAEASHKFMNDVRDVLAMLQLVADRVLIGVMPAIEAVIRGLEEADTATNGWSTMLIGLALVLAPILALLGPVVAGVVALALGITALISDFETWKRGAASFIDWSAWSDQIDAALGGVSDLQSAFGDLADALSPVLKLLGQVFGGAMKILVKTFLSEITDMLRTMAETVRAVASGFRILGDLWHGDAVGARRDAGAAGGHLLGAGKSLLAGIVDPLRGAWDVISGKPDTKAGASAMARAAALHAGQIAQGAQAVHGAVAAQVMDFFRQAGLSGEQSRGLTAGIAAESRLNPHAVNPTSGAFGIGQWLGDRKARLFRLFGPNPTLDQQLKYLLWELQGGDQAGASVLGAGSASATMTNYLARFMRPGAGLAGDLARGAAALSALSDSRLASGGAAVHVSQKTDVHVHGAGDAASTGRAVANEQGRVNGDMIRQLKVAAS
jgi:hypothetical protein